jgi:hypothetical protein
MIKKATFISEPRETNKPRVTTADLLAKIEQNEQDTKVIQKLWSSLLDKPIPDNRQCHIWLSKYDIGIISEAIDQAVIWLSKLDQELAEVEEQGLGITPEEKEANTKSYLDKIKYTSKTMSNLREGKE